MIEKPNIVIVGGGAGGLELATALGHKLGKPNKATITLIDKNLTHIWKPLLHQAAVGALDSSEDELNYITHAHCHYYKFQWGELSGLDRKQKLIELLLPRIHNNVERKNIYLPYDILIIAVGSVSNSYGITGVKEYCYYLDDHKQAEQFRHDFINKLILRQHNVDEGQTTTLNVTIIGGGATGVELAAELHYLINKAIYYGLGKADTLKQNQITIIEGADRILSALPERISTATLEELKKLDIKIITNERVKEVTKSEVITAGGLRIPTTVTVWAAGIKAPDFLKGLDDLETNRLNQLIVKHTLQTTRDTDIFAFGDCAACLQRNGKTLVPARAQAAHQQAATLAKSIGNILKGRAPIQYHYRDYGSLISISRYQAIGQLMGRIARVMIEGKIAQLVYLSLYKMHQIKCHGWWRVTLFSLSRLLIRRVKPKLKLH